MATSITHEDIKPRIAIPSATTTYDTELDTICTSVAAGVDAYVAAAFLASNAALVKEAAIEIATGTAIIGMLNRPGYAESFAGGGVQVGGLTKDGAVDLIRQGWALVAPFSAAGNADELAKQAEAVLRKALAEARDDDTAAQADAELAKIEADVDLVTEQVLKVAAETSKLAADEALVTSKKGVVDDQKALLDLEVTRATAAAAALESAQGSVTGDLTFARDSAEYD